MDRTTDIGVIGPAGTAPCCEWVGPGGSGYYVKMVHNLLQAQRDYFGAHTCERIDREGHFHTDWKKGRLEPSHF